MAKIVQFKKLNKACSEEAFQALRNLEDLDPDEIYGTHLVNEGRVYKLHLELEGSSREDFSESEKQRWQILQKNGKVEQSISRDILAPGDLNLHSLHYVINRLFGWQNSHLHRFYLPQERFEQMTAGRLASYLDLCGILFRFPTDDSDVDYWDDDYEEGQNFKNWLREKYTRPYINLSPRDTFFGNSFLAGVFRQDHPQFTDSEHLDQIMQEMALPRDFNELMENRTLSELFVKMPDGEPLPDVRVWKLSEIMDAVAEHQEMERKVDSDKNISEEMQMAHFMLSDVEVYPYFDTIYYNYDFGDNWTVKITVEEVYYPDFEFLDDPDDTDWEDEEYFEDDMDEEDLPFGDDYADEDDEIDEMIEALFAGKPVERMLNDMDDEDDFEFMDADRNVIQGDLLPLLWKVETEGAPVCLAADGLNVMDDCGGVRGYINLLSEIYGKDKETAAESRTWARGMGWTGRKSKPENML